MDYRHLNQRIFVHPKEWERPISGPYLGRHMKVAFKTVPGDVLEAIRNIIGEGILLSDTPRHILHSQIVSVFLSNWYDLIPNYKVFKKMTKMLLKEDFVSEDELHEAIMKYSLQSSNAWIGGLFPPSHLKNKKELVRLFDILKLALEGRDLHLRREIVKFMDLLPSGIIANAFLLFDNLSLILAYVENSGVMASSPPFIPQSPSVNSSRSSRNWRAPRKGKGIRLSN